MKCDSLVVEVTGFVCRLAVTLHAGTVSVATDPWAYSICLFTAATKFTHALLIYANNTSSVSTAVKKSGIWLPPTLQRWECSAGRSFSRSSLMAACCQQLSRAWSKCGSCWLSACFVGCSGCLVGVQLLSSCLCCLDRNQARLSPHQVFPLL